MSDTVIFITGASSGIGLEIVKLLAPKGYFIFAGVRKQKDADFLVQISSNVQPVFLDLTSEDDLDNVCKQISVSGKKLSCIINNAGISILHPLEEIRLDDLRKQFEVNTFAQIKLIQRFLPFTTNKFKIINISSITSELVLPFNAPYCASKRASEILFESLKYEVPDKDISIITIKPGCINTEIWNKTVYNTLKDLSPDSKYKNIVMHITKIMQETASKSKPPVLVAQTVLKAIKKQHPKRTYYTGLDSKILSVYNKFLPCVMSVIIFKILKKWRKNNAN